jgi:hypothetical protein
MPTTYLEPPRARKLEDRVGVAHGLAETAVEDDFKQCIDPARGLT